MLLRSHVPRDCVVCLLLTPLPLSKGKKQAYVSSRGTTNLLSSVPGPVFMLEGRGAPLTPGICPQNTSMHHIEHLRTVPRPSVPSPLNKAQKEQAPPLLGWTAALQSPADEL